MKRVFLINIFNLSSITSYYLLAFLLKLLINTSLDRKPRGHRYDPQHWPIRERECFGVAPLPNTPLPTKLFTSYISILMYFFFCGTECIRDKFLCESEQRCMPDDWLCDGEVDCEGGQDERDCGEYLSYTSIHVAVYSMYLSTSDWLCDGEVTGLRGRPGRARLW